MRRVIAILVIASSGAALAQPAGAQAEVLFREGRELLSAGKTAEACAAFQESQKLEPAVTTLINLAGCREKLGQIATAWGLFLDAVRQTRAAHDAPTRRLHDLAQARARKLEPRISKLTINVPLASQFDGLEISRDAERIDPGLWNRALPIDGGAYRITARAAGANEWSTQVAIAPETDVKTVQIPDLRNLPRDLETPAATPRLPGLAVQPPPPREPPPPAVTAAASPRRAGLVVPLVVGSAAVALFGGGLAFELWAESNYDAAKSENTVQTRRDSQYQSANTKRYVAEALAATGLAAGGAAIWLYLGGGDREGRAASRAGVRVAPTASGVVVFGDF